MLKFQVYNSVWIDIATAILQLTRNLSWDYLQANNAKFRSVAVSARLEKFVAHMRHGNHRDRFDQQPYLTMSKH
jgi:hypothetical protein